MNTSQLDAAIQIPAGIPVPKFWVDDTHLSDDRRIPVELDAIFIPTLGARPHIYRQIDALATRCSALFVTTSREGSIDWSLIKAKNVQEIRLESEFLEMPSWQFDPKINPQVAIRRSFDLPAKRNLALTYAQAEGFGRIALVDDDILFSDPPLQMPQSAVEAWTGIGGYYVLDFPDVSTVDFMCAVLRGELPSVSLGGSCIVVDRTLFDLRFPYVYNEDWLFLTSAALRGSPVVALGSMGQLAHAPWTDLSRVAFEQFGDVLAGALAEMGVGAGSKLQIDSGAWQRAYDEQLGRVEAALTNGSQPRAFRVAFERARSALGTFTARPVEEFFVRWLNEQTLNP